MSGIKIESGYVLSAARMKGSHNLILTVALQGYDVHGEATTVVTNLGKFIEPEDIFNKKCLFRTDLEPVEIKKVLSQAMIICAQNEEGSLFYDADNFPEGSFIKL